MHRRQHEGGEADHRRNAGGALRQHRLQVGQIEEGQDQAAQHPGERENRSDQIGRARRLALQGLQDHADRLAVVVGGAARLRLVVGGGRGADALEQILVGVQAAAVVDQGRGRLGIGGAAGGSLVRGAQGLLDRREGRFRRVLNLLRIVRHVRRRLALLLKTYGRELNGSAPPARAARVIVVVPNGIPCLRGPAFCADLSTATEARLIAHPIGPGGRMKPDL